MKKKWIPECYSFIAFQFQTYKESEPKRQSVIFTTEDINKFLFSPEVPNENYWLVRKAYVIVAFFGGLRVSEMHSMALGDLEDRPGMGIYIKFKRSTASKFLVPESTR